MGSVIACEEHEGSVNEQAIQREYHEAKPHIARIDLHQQHQIEEVLPSRGAHVEVTSVPRIRSTAPLRADLDPRTNTLSPSVALPDTNRQVDAREYTSAEQTSNYFNPVSLAAGGALYSQQLDSDLV